MKLLRFKEKYVHVYQAEVIYSQFNWLKKGRGNIVNSTDLKKKMYHFL